MSEAPKHPTPLPDEGDSDDEMRLLRGRNLAIIGGGLFLLIFFVLGVAAVFMAFFGPENQQPPSVPQVPEPRLQVNESVNYQDLKATEEARLNGYKWIDQDAGIVQIPIDRAMDLVAERGLPLSFSAQASPTPGGTPGTPGATENLTAEGEQVFQSLGCNSCHMEADSPVAPTLHGLFGNQVTLASGETVTADEDYLRESILNPTAKIHQGYQPIMPSFEGRVNDQQMQALLAYIESLANGGS